MDEANQEKTGEPEVIGTGEEMSEIWRIVDDIRSLIDELDLLKSIGKARQSGMNTTEIVDMLGGPDEVERKLGTERAKRLIEGEK